MFIEESTVTFLAAGSPLIISLIRVDLKPMSNIDHFFLSKGTSQQLVCLTRA